MLERLRAFALAGRDRAGWLFRLAWMQSLPSRLILGVFSTVLVTSLAVAFTATHSTESFLRDEIDQKFPAILEQTAERVEIWYAQRQLDVETFAHSQIVQENLAAQGKGGRRSQLARAELSKYLAYVLQRFPQYESLFLLGRDGLPVLSVGADLSLPDVLKEQLAGLERSQVSDVHVVAGVRSQVASATVKRPDGRRMGSLHAVLAPDAIDALLTSEDLSGAGRIIAVSAAGEVIAPLGALGVPEAGPEGEPAQDRVGQHVLDGGERVIAARHSFARFGWQLWVVEPYEAAFAPVVSMIRRVWAVNLAIVLLLGGVALWIARSMARPIHDLSKAARRIAQGAEGVEIPVSARADEVGVLSRAFQEMTSRLSEKHLELQRANEVLTQLSITDGLTGLYNHRAFQDRLARDSRRAERTGTPLCLALIDVDNFKRLNDQHGHAVGDQILAGVAKVLQEQAGEADFVARYGGEEFAWLSPAPIEEAIAVLENLRSAVGATLFQPDEGEAIRVTISIGVATLGSDPADVFDAADRALYEAKHSGKDCVVAAEA